MPFASHNPHHSKLVSPHLLPGRDYIWEVHSRWLEEGQPVERVRSVHVRADLQTAVDLRRPEPTPEVTGVTVVAGR
jgi:hypothetical protein